jgi:hypothetical protein
MAEKFEQWCILEIMGHQTFAGLVSEQAIGGASFVRIDVPEADGLPAFSKCFGAGSIYCITPVSVYDLPSEIRDRLRTPALPAAQEDFEDDFELENG